MSMGNTAGDEPPADTATPTLIVDSWLQNLRKQYTPQTPTAEHAAANQKAHETAVLIVTLVTFVVLGVFVFFLSPFAQ
jgi:hypothetical protein